jgi:hypothetical protein
MSAFSSAFVARQDRYRGAFEAHLTVATTQQAQLAAVCEQLGVAYIAIELASGAHASQPMTASHHHGELAAVLAEISALHDRLVAAGFAVVRVKLEADPSNPGVPVTDGETDGYFEFHVKVRDPDVARLTTTSERHGARVSQNARDDISRFVTLRVHGAGRATADARLGELLAALAADGHAVLDTTREYTIYDSALELDAGWS